MPKLFQPFRNNRQTTLFFLTLGLLAAGGSLLLLYSTPRGLGLNDDSIAYIAGARGIVSGQGFRELWLVSQGQMIHFPPGFPGALALIDLMTGLDPLRGARALNAVLFGLNILLTGWLGKRITGSRISGLFAAALTLLSSSILYIHSRAMSEPLYIFLTLVTFLLLEIYLNRSHHKINQTLLLVILGFILGWAYLARYAALSLLATVLTVLIIFLSDWRKRLWSAGILIVSTLPWIIAWSVRNKIVGGSSTNRSLGWHPITAENWTLGVSTFAEFFIPLNSWRNNVLQISGIFEIILILIGLALLIWVLRKGWPHFWKPDRTTPPDVLTFSSALYIIVYIAALVTTMTIFDPATKFQVRILSPTYISLILILAALGNWLWQRKTTIWKIAIVLLALALLGMSSFSQLKNAQDIRERGGTFAKEKWSDSEAIAAIQELPPNTLIFTNEPGVVYLYTGRPGAVLPKDEPGISTIKELILNGEAVLVLFRVNKADPETIDYYYQLGSGLYLIDYSNSWVFTAFPK